MQKGLETRQDWDLHLSSLVTVAWALGSLITSYEDKSSYDKCMKACTARMVGACLSQVMTFAGERSPLSRIQPQTFIASLAHHDIEKNFLHRTISCVTGVDFLGEGGKRKNMYIYI